MNTEFNQGYVAGLKEALRLMALEESIDFGPGRILARIKQIEDGRITEQTIRFSCFKCGDGNTPLYCLNCAREGWKQE